MTCTFPAGRLARPAGALIAALLGIAFALAVDAPRAAASSCAGSMQGDGSFSFTCDTQLGTEGPYPTQRFFLDGIPDAMTLTSGMITSPAGFTCFGGGDLLCKGPIVPAGTMVSGSAVAAEGAFCDRIPAPSISAFFAGSPYAAIFAGGLQCPPESATKEQRLPKWKRQCLQKKSKRARKNCIRKHKKGNR